jgi:integrase/recombinase XerD
MPKTNRSGQAATLSPEQLDRIMATCDPIYRAAVSICRFTACRITECLSLRWENMTMDSIVFPRQITKKKMATRTIPISPKLQAVLEEWRGVWQDAFKRCPEKSDFVFPSQRDSRKRLVRQRVDDALRAVCQSLGLEGVSTHSFRRSALTQASAAGVPLRHIQALSGHSSLEQLQRYLDTTDAQKRAAAMAFG